MSPKFSIIIPVYNVAPYLRECLDSVLAQTYTDWEAICVDDGSTDESGVILDEYAVRDSRFRVMHQSNAGVSAARNRALEEAKGEWIGFLDADDIVKPNWLADVAQAIEEKPCADIIRTGWTKWSGQEHKEYSQIRRPHVLWGLIAEFGFPFLSFIRSDFIGGMRFRRGVRMREDALFQYEVALRKPKFAVVESCGYLRRERVGSATYQSRKRDDSTKLLTAYLDVWKKQDKRDRSLHRSASTRWICKDVGDWYRFCPDRTLSDSVGVWLLVWKAVAVGAFNPLGGGSLKDAVRRGTFLMTGWGAVLRLNLDILRRKR